MDLVPEEEYHSRPDLQVPEVSSTDPQLGPPYTRYGWNSLDVSLDVITVYNVMYESCDPCVVFPDDVGFVLFARPPIGACTSYKLG